MIVDAEIFRNLPTTEVARLVRASGSKVCVFPSNGTRRWYMLEHLSRGAGDLKTYMEITARHHAKVFKMFFDHGLDTLLVPLFGPDLLERGEDYAQAAMNGLTRLATQADYLDFYQASRVRVRFYGAYDKLLPATSRANLLELFEKTTAQTLAHDQHRLFIGLFAHDATETVAEIAVRFYQQHGRAPDRRQIVETYYGEYVEPVDLFIGFDKFSAFDMPLLSTGHEDLYFTVSPSPYLTPRQLRDILYDHLYSRRGEPDYWNMTPEDWSWMRAFYQTNMENTLGVGLKRRGIWYPLPQVEQPAGFGESDEIR
jgi:hypothetical protein